MQTKLSTTYRHTPEGQEAEAILRACVHCGFCTATCPTYQLLGDELDSPRGRIYLIKQLLEGEPVSAKTQLHLDRCLTCRACETTCPSGVRYGRLVDIGRELVDRKVPRSLIATLSRYLLRQLIPHPKRFSTLLSLGRLVKPLLPRTLKNKIPVVQTKTPWPQQSHARQMLVLEGCAQRIVSANTNAATARVLHRIGIQLLTAPTAGCCGALSQHLSAHEEALNFMRNNIDAWWPFIEQGIEAIIVTASGCGTIVKDYGELLKNDPIYRDKAKRVSLLAKDISEILRDENIPTAKLKSATIRVAFHSPCTLQHGQQINGVVETMLSNAGYTLTAVDDGHLCCGSAGTYSILQPRLAQQLLANKLSALTNGKPDIIATANIGCQLHLASKANIPVKHWIELLDNVLI